MYTCHKTLHWICFDLLFILDILVIANSPTQLNIGGFIAVHLLQKWLEIAVINENKLEDNTGALALPMRW